MKRYEKYKDSGIEGLGEIPEHWEKGKLSFFTEVKDGTHDTPSYVDESKDSFPLVTSKDLVTGKLDFSSCKYISEEDHKAIITRSNVSKNDIVMPMIGTVGSPVIVDTEIKFSIKNVALFKTSYNSKFTSNFLYYLLKSDVIEEQFGLDGRGGVQNFVSLSILRNLKVFYLPINEQTTIAAFLDHKTSQIDVLIEKKEQLIEKLKLQRQAIINEAVTKGLNPNAPMKDSGIEWLGEIPEHWKEAKVKHVAQINGRIGFKGYTKEDLVNEGEGALTLGAKHIDKDNNLDLSSPEYISWEKYYESPEIMVKVDDVIITQRGSLGKVCHINKPIGEATINPSMVILNNISIQPRYLYFWLCSNRIQSEVHLLQANTAVPMISQFQLENFPVIFPENDVQNNIIEYLDETLNSFKNIIDKSLDSIEKLKLYRQSLISEAVTGKIDVRDWELTKTN